MPGGGAFVLLRYKLFPLISAISFAKLISDESTGKQFIERIMCKRYKKELSRYLYLTTHKLYNT